MIEMLPSEQFTYGIDVASCIISWRMILLLVFWLVTQTQNWAKGNDSLLSISVVWFRSIAGHFICVKRELAAREIQSEKKNRSRK